MLSGPLVNTHCPDLEGEALLSTLEQTHRSKGDLRLPRARKWKRRARDLAGQSNPEGCSNSSIVEDVVKKHKKYIYGLKFKTEGQYKVKKLYNGNSEPRRKTTKRKIYRFEQIWIRSEECQKIIQENWENGTTTSNLDGLRRKCGQVGKALSSWNWTKPTLYLAISVCSGCLEPTWLSVLVFARFPSPQHDFDGDGNCLEPTRLSVLVLGFRGGLQLLSKIDRCGSSEGNWPLKLLGVMVECWGLFCYAR
ncbi:hypothetical protein U1Q18_009416 [Sarracenia purpurea var. burkii]